MPLRYRRLGSILLVVLVVSIARAERPSARGLSDTLGGEDAAVTDSGQGADIDDAALLNALAMSGGNTRTQRPLRRFDNGPRAVPVARGRALARAQLLGIGDQLSTKHLLWSRPSPELMAAVPGPAPKSLLWPVLGGKWGRGFGFTRKVLVDLRHNGIDIGAPLGTPVRAAADGLVIYSDNGLHDLGNAVMILHPGGFTTLYAHTMRTTVQPGYYVKRGERIALVGQTGAALGPHTHFELRDNGRWRDPEPFIVGYRDLELNGPLVDLAGATPAHASVAAAATATPAAPAAPAPHEQAARTQASREPARSSEPVAIKTAATTEHAAATTLPLQVGKLAAAKRMLRGSPPAIGDEAQLGRRFSNLLFPVKGGHDASQFDAARHRALDLTAELGAPVRAAADGVVVYSGEELGGLGRTIVLWHRAGWVTVYGCLSAEGAAEPGAHVLRGEWIGHVATGEASTAPHLHFEWLDHGERRDPNPRLVGR